MSLKSNSADGRTSARGAILDFQRLAKIGHDAITVLIIANFVTIALSTYQSLSEFEPFFAGFDQACIVVFIVEMAVRIIFGGKGFWVGKNVGWNYFDLIVTGLSSVGGLPGLSILRIARVLRLFMSVRLISAIKPLRVITRSIFSSLPSIGWIGLLLLFFDMIYTVMATLIFGQAFPEWYGSLERSFYSMIELMTMEGWTDTARTVMAEFPMAWIFFLSYIFIAAYILLNAVAGVLVDGMMSPQTEASTAREEEMLTRQEDTNQTIRDLQKQIEELKELITTNQK